MKYLFILGNNIELSIAEIKNYLEKIGNKIIESSVKEKGYLLDLKEKLKENTIDFLGGTIAIGQVLSEDLDKLDDIEVYLGEKNKLNYSLWNFSLEYDLVKDYLKKRFKQEKIKAVFKHLENSSRTDEEYFVFEDYFGKLIQKCDYKTIEKRDMDKPVRRQSLAISPRLGKIMINLAQIKENETLVDCFCGIGVILQEALLQKIKVIGIDMDKDAITGANKNLEWFKFNNEDYKLFNKNSKEVAISNANAIVTEPNLGQILKKSPSETSAKKTLKEFENLMIDVLNNLKKKISKRIVFTSPLINVHKKRLACDIEEITKNTGLKLIEPYFDDFRPGQVVGRRIFILE